MSGYFRKRGKKWSFTIDLSRDSNSGERIQVTKSGFMTKKDAQIMAAKIIQDSANGVFINEKDITFSEFVAEWLKIYEKTSKISSLRVRKHESTKLIEYFGNLKIKNITKLMYQNALLDLQNRGLALNTISGVHVTATMIFKKAIEFEIIKSNPTEYAKVPKEKKTIEEIENEDKKVKYLERSELIEFLKIARQKGLERDYEVFLTLSYTGMRVGELCALKWSDVNFNSNTISISKTYYNPTNNTKEFYLLTPKTNSSIRTIEIDDTVTKALKKLKFLQEDIKRTTEDYYDGDFVFAKTVNNAGYPEHIKLIENRMERLLKLAGIDKKLTPHSLRHTHTSLLAEAGVGLFEIMDRLGHQDDKTTKQVYLHITNTMKKEAVSKFSKLMAGGDLIKESPLIYAIAN